MSEKTSDEAIAAVSFDSMDWRDKSRRVAGIGRTAERAAEAAAAVAKKIRMRRFPWRRKWQSGPYMHADDKRLRLVALRSGAMLPVVEAFVDRLDDYANQYTPRGSVFGFSIEELAAHWGLDDDELLARIYAVLESPEIGWIHDDFIVDFWLRNPDTEDNTAADRQARSTAFRKAFGQLALLSRQGLIDEPTRTAKEIALHALRDQGRGRQLTWAEQKAELKKLLDFSTAPSPHDVSDRETVMLTARADQTFIEAGKCVDNFPAAASGELQGLSEGQAAGAQSSPHPSLGASGLEGGTRTQQDEAATAELWLKSEGLKLVIERMAVKRTKAETLIERWLARVEGDHGALAAVIAGAGERTATAAAFHVIISDGCDRHVKLKDGPVFAMGPPRLNNKPAPASDQKALGESLERLGDAMRKQGGGHG